jgi:hypothetical protein
LAPLLKIKDMKYILLLLVIFLGSGCKTEKETIEIKIDGGSINGMISSGEFFKKGYKDTYWFGATTPKSKIGFIVATFHRGIEKEGKAYLLIDSLERAGKMNDLDSTVLSRMPPEEIKEDSIVKSRRHALFLEIQEHVYLIVSKEAIQTGIDYDSKLIYK